jgi:hypothetical protein
MKTDYGINMLQRPEDRIEKSGDPLDDFICAPLENHTFREVNLVLPGSSFRREDVIKDTPVIFVNPRPELEEYVNSSEMHYVVTMDFCNFAEIIGLEKPANKRYALLKNHSNAILLLNHANNLKEKQSLDIGNFLEGSSPIAERQREILEKLGYKTNKKWMSGLVFPSCQSQNVTFGSGQGAIVFFAKTCRKVYVHGWDQYADESDSVETGSLFKLFVKAHCGAQLFLINISAYHFALKFLQQKKSNIILVSGAVKHLKKFKSLQKITDKIYYS